MKTFREFELKEMAMSYTKEGKPSFTGADFERSIVNDGPHHRGGAGAQTPDHIVTAGKHEFNLEAKAGKTIDFEQSTVHGDVHAHDDGTIHKVTMHTPQGKTAKRFPGIVDTAVKHVNNLVNRNFVGQKMPEHAEHRGSILGGVAKMLTGDKKSLNHNVSNKDFHKVAHHSGDPVHVHHHTETGEIAVFPVSNEHRKFTDAMGLKKQVSLEDIANNPKERRKSLGVSGRLRRKERRASYSLQGNSNSIVNAVKRNGGKVFNGIEDFHDHMREHGVRIRSGHTKSGSDSGMNESLWNKPIQSLNEKWTKSYKDSINCENPKGFSQKAHCDGKKAKEVNESIQKRGKKYVVTNKAGDDVLGTHRTRQDAVDQLRAIEASKSERMKESFDFEVASALRNRTTKLRRTFNQYVTEKNTIEELLEKKAKKKKECSCDEKRPKTYRYGGYYHGHDHGHDDGGGDGGDGGGE